MTLNQKSKGTVKTKKKNKIKEDVFKSENDKSSVWEYMLSKSYFRKEFLQFCAYTAATAGIALSDVDKAIYALEKRNVSLLFGCIFGNVHVVVNLL